MHAVSANRRITASSPRRWTRRCRTASSPSPARWTGIDFPAFADTDALARSLALAGGRCQRPAAADGAARGGHSSTSADRAFLGLLSGSAGGRTRRRLPRLVHALERETLRAGGDRVTFADVAGIDEAKAELWRWSTSFAAGRCTPTGRSYPARRAAQRRAGHGQDAARPAVVEKADVPISRWRPRSSSRRSWASARRVRDLFKEAKQAAPAIVFIDELDAVGGSRAATAGSAGATTSASRR